MEVLWAVASKHRDLLVSTEGELADRTTGSIINQSIVSRGYKGITRGGKTIYTHRVVAETFLKNQKRKAQVNHKNGDKTDNNIDNLEWTTPRENSLHSTRVLCKNIHISRAARPIMCVETRELYTSVTGAARAVGAKHWNISYAAHNGTRCANKHWVYV